MAEQDTRTYVRSGIWRSAVLTLIALIVFVGIVVGLDVAFRPQLSGPVLIFVGILLALVPAALWLIFFYLQDRYEPEPKAEVARIFVIGLALAGAIGLPLTTQVFHVQDWLYRDTLTLVMGSIFVNGAVEAFIVYATVRYFIYHSAEFDERSDGLVYGTAAGLGYATMLNAQFILLSGGAALGPAEVTIAEVALAHAAFGGVLGYFLGRAKLEREPGWWLPAGLLLTAVLNGLFAVLRSQVVSGAIYRGAPSPVPPMFGLALSGGLAVVVAVVVTYLINRDVRLAISGKRPAPTADAAVGDRQANVAVIVVFVVLILIGGVTWSGAESQVTAFDVGGFKGSYPAHFGVATTPDDVLRVVDTLGTQAQFAIQTISLQSGQDTRNVISLLAADRGARFDAYQVLGTEETTLKGRPATLQHFAYVEPPGTLRTMPRLIEGTDYIVVDGGKAVIVTLLAAPDTYASVEPLFQRFVEQLSF
jgi:RsiW-degrading membrane proteinase PrsW (M82 family)